MEQAKYNDEKSASVKRRLKVAVSVALLAVASAACTTSSAHNKSSSPTANSSKKTTTATTALPTPTTTTTTTLPPQVTKPSGKFLGAMEIVRDAPGEVDYSDSTVIHRLNNGIWETSTSGAAEVDTNSMLAYGFSYFQNTAPFGTIGETSVTASHDVTRINANVYLNGINYNQPEVTQNIDVPPQDDIPNLDLGDKFVIYLDQPDNKMEVLTYQIDQTPYTFPQSDTAELNALANPPTNPAESQLIDVTCFPPYTEDDWEVFPADLVSTQIVTGNASYFGTEPPIHNPSDNQ
jgi:hypothetical protein